MNQKERVLPKRVFFSMLAIIIAGVFILSSCASAEQRCYNNFVTFVESVEQGAPSFTKQDWEACSQAYDVYVQDLDAYSQLYTPEQNREIGRLKARYHKVCVNYYINRASDIINSMSHQMEGYLDEMSDTDNDYSVTPAAERLEQNINDAIERVSNIVEE